mmetsp:Transcript_6163/g.9044  ORF Transcript_6163/g.9044 Transcript_6163/m.9044 type:complete len:279 (+) Transcript_6163:454-1290(+)
MRRGPVFRGTGSLFPKKQGCGRRSDPIIVRVGPLPCRLSRRCSRIFRGPRGVQSVDEILPTQQETKRSKHRQEPGPKGCLGPCRSEEPPQKEACQFPFLRVHLRAWDLLHGLAPAVLPRVGRERASAHLERERPQFLDHAPADANRQLDDDPDRSHGPAKDSAERPAVPSSTFLERSESKLVPFNLRVLQSHWIAGGLFGRLFVPRERSGGHFWVAELGGNPFAARRFDRRTNERPAHYSPYRKPMVLSILLPRHVHHCHVLSAPDHAGGSVRSGELQ